MSGRRASGGIAEAALELYWGARRGLRSVRRLLQPVARCRVGGLTILIQRSTAHEQVRAETYATKEPETIAWIQHRLGAGDVLFDVGANIGLYSLFAARLRPGCHVVAFEPESHNFASLCRNVALNRLDNITACAFALSDREGFDVFQLHALEAGSALHSLGDAGDLSGEPSVFRHAVLTTTLDAVVERGWLPQPNLLKLDVDGIEERILHGAVAVLGSERLRSLLLEVSSPAGDQVSWAERALVRFGFRCTGLSQWITQLGGLVSRNLVFDR